MKRYFRGPGEPGSEDWLVWLELDDRSPTRQVELVKGRWYSSREEYHADLGSGLGDQELSDQELAESGAMEITAQEFERVWTESGSR